ncbi:MAG: RNA polymerase sigma factor [Variovorax sp.]|nr:MAG: RNA polymerase sigma factor [Variovorax sp.]
MTESLKNTLRALFMTRYSQFRKHLQLRLGSEDLANDALHETYLRLENMRDQGAVQYPSAYLFRIALNVAEDQRKSSARLITVAEVEELYDMADEMADPARTAEGRAELEALDRAMAELPRRRRAMLLAARVEELPHRDIALRFGVSPRTVEKELRAALEHCCERLGRDFIQRFGPGAGKQSRQDA